MPRSKNIPHVKRARVKGKEYLYFRTGRRKANGEEVLARLPSLSDPGFGGAYASFIAARSRRQSLQSQPELTVTQLCELYELSPHFKGLSASTKRVYRGSLAYLMKRLPTAPAGEIQRQDIVRLLDQRADKPGAANLLIRSIAAMYKWARNRGHVHNDPCRDIELFKLGQHTPWPDDLLEAALTAEDDLVRLGVHLLFFTAQRIGDVLTLRWTDVAKDQDGVRWLRLAGQEKTGKPIEFELHPRLAAELDRYDKRLGYILQGKKGRPMAEDTLRKALEAFAKARGHKVVPHGLRKNAVNDLLEAECSTGQISAITGQSLKMVEHYSKGRSQRRLASAAILKWRAHK